MAKQYAEEYTVNELITCFLSREFEDGEEFGVGAASPIARGATLLAHWTRCPNSTLRLNFTRTNLSNVFDIVQYELECDYRAQRWAERYNRDDEEMEWCRRLGRKKGQRFFMGPIQIDKFGNANLIGVGSDFKRLKFRGPGGVGTTTITAYAKCYYLLPTRHDARTFVEKCDDISAPGWGDGGPDGRLKLGLPGGGPKYCVTSLCVMDFEEDTKRMRLKSLHPGVSVDDVVKNTGFELIVPKELASTDPPTIEEIEVLRNRIDREGLLRK